MWCLGLWRALGARWRKKWRQYRIFAMQNPASGLGPCPCPPEAPLWRYLKKWVSLSSLLAPGAAMCSSPRIESLVFVLLRKRGLLGPVSIELNPQRLVWWSPRQPCGRISNDIYEESVKKGSNQVRNENTRKKRVPAFFGSGSQVFYVSKRASA